MGQRDQIGRLPFEERLQIGKEFEMRVAAFLKRQGHPIGLYFEAEEQWAYGESEARVEIKLDTLFKETGNLFIETRERRREGQSWRDAGIHDYSHPLDIVIGDYGELWWLEADELRQQHKFGGCKLKKTATSEGFLLPVIKANMLAFRHWTNWSNE